MSGILFYLAGAYSVQHPPFFGTKDYVNIGVTSLPPLLVTCSGSYSILTTHLHILLSLDRLHFYA